MKDKLCLTCSVRLLTGGHIRENTQGVRINVLVVKNSTCICKYKGKLAVSYKLATGMGHSALSDLGLHLT